MVVLWQWVWAMVAGGWWQWVSKGGWWLGNGGLVVFVVVRVSLAGGFGFGLAVVAWQCLMVFVVQRVGLAVGF